jgi:hypothetical protein
MISGSRAHLVIELGDAWSKRNDVRQRSYQTGIGQHAQIPVKRRARQRKRFIMSGAQRSAAPRTGRDIHHFLEIAPACAAGRVLGAAFA